VTVIAEYPVPVLFVSENLLQVLFLVREYFDLYLVRIHMCLQGYHCDSKVFYAFLMEAMAE
jgi:hypothetical protein